MRRLKVFRLKTHFTPSLLERSVTATFCTSFCGRRFSPDFVQSALADPPRVPIISPFNGLALYLSPSSALWEHFGKVDQQKAVHDTILFFYFFSFGGSR